MPSDRAEFTVFSCLGNFHSVTTFRFFPLINFASINRACQMIANDLLARAACALSDLACTLRARTRCSFTFRIKTKYNNKKSSYVAGYMGHMHT